MKSIFFCLACIFITKQLYSQHTIPPQKYSDTAYFEDGSSVPYYSFSAINTPPKHIISLSPTTITFIGRNNPASFGCNVIYMNRVNNRLLIDSKFYIPYSKKVDAVFNENLQKSTFEIGGNISYKFKKRIKPRKRSIYILTKPSVKAAYDYDKYGLEFQMPYVTNFYLTGGVNFLRTASINDGLDIVDQTKYDYVLLGNTSSVSLNIGITRDRYTYHIYSSEQLGNRPHYKYYRVRNYLYLTYSPYASYTVIGRDKYNDDSYSKITSDYVEPLKIKRLGWRFGAEFKIGSGYLHNLPYFGIEMGRILALVIDDFNAPISSSYYLAQQQGYISGSLYIQLKAGFEFGSRNHNRKNFTQSKKAALQMKNDFNVI